MPDLRLKLYRGSWYAVWSGQGRGTQRRSLRTKDREEAKRCLIDLKAAIAAPGGFLVGDIVDMYLVDKQGRIADHDRLRYGWEKAKRHFSHLRPDQITRQVCRDYIELRRTEGERARGYPTGDATIFREISIVRQALNWNGIQGAIFETPSHPPPRDRHLTRAEFDTLLASCTSPHIRLFVVLALSTAGRKTAILELTWDRVDFAREQIQLGIVGARNRKRRALVPMTARLKAELINAEKSAVSPYVIEYGGDKVRDIKKGFASAVKRAGLKNVTPHDIRHSAAVWMAEQGIAMDEIAQFLGHTDPRVTYRVYARFSPQYLKRAASALEF